MKRTKQVMIAAALVTAFTTNSQAQNWLTGGNASAGTEIFGTTTNQSINFITNNTSRMFLSKKGDLGIGTTNPTFMLDVFSATSASANFKSSGGNSNLIIDRGNSSSTSSVSYRTAGVPTWQTGTVQTDNFAIRNIALTSTALTILAANSNVGIGTNAPASRFMVSGDATQTTPTVDIATSYVGNSDVRGISVTSKPADGWGYGIQATGGYFGGYLYGDGGTYIGGTTGVYGYADGSAGVRYGVLGSASNTGGIAYGVYASAVGSSSENSWGGYFVTKSYANELRVGGEQGAAGYVACINGKLIAEEVRVALKAAWPDYVFDANYSLMSINDLKNSISTNKHLPGLPSACDVEENGLHLGEMQTKIVEKIEESHLYIIQLQQQIDELKAEIKSMKNQDPK